MRIRKSASRLLGSSYAASAAPLPDVAPPLDHWTPPPPPPPPAPPQLSPCSAPESRAWGRFSNPATASGETCQLSRSPWDLIAELSLSDPEAEDELVDKYFVHVTTRSSWLFSATMPSTSANKKKLPAACRDSAQPRREVVKKAAMNKPKESENKKKAKVKKEEGQEKGGPRPLTCKKNDGKRWHCNRPVSQPDTLCDYHSVQKRSYLNPGFEFPSTAESEAAAAPAPAPVPTAATYSKSSTSNKPRKKKPGSNFSATEGFYYYAGFGPFRSKRQCRSGGTNEPVPAKKEEDETPEDASNPTGQADEAAEVTIQNARVPQHDVSGYDNNVAAIAGVDEDSSDDEYDGIGIAGCDMDGSGDPQGSSGDAKRKIPWKRWRKPVKARSLMSLM